MELSSFESTSREDEEGKEKKNRMKSIPLRCVDRCFHCATMSFAMMSSSKTYKRGNDKRGVRKQSSSFFLGIDSLDG